MEGHFLSAPGGPLRGPGLRSLLFLFSLRTYEFHDNTDFKTVKCLTPVVRVYTGAYLRTWKNRTETKPVEPGAVQGGDPRLLSPLGA